MPIYCFKRKDGRIVERFMHRRGPRAPRQIRCEDGEVALRDIGAEYGKPRPAKLGKWPIISEAAGIHPSQVPEAVKRFPHHKFMPGGAMIFENPSHWRRCVRDIGMVDLS